MDRNRKMYLAQMLGIIPSDHKMLQDQAKALVLAYISSDGPVVKCPDATARGGNYLHGRKRTALPMQSTAWGKQCGTVR